MHIEVSGLSKWFEPGKPVLEDLNLSFENKAFTGLLGPSGCGKTTLLRIISGLDQPNRGKVKFNDMTVVDMAKGQCVPPEKREVSMVFQNYAIWPHMTVFENVAFPLQMAKVPKPQIKDRVEEVLVGVKMAELAERLPSSLSGGQQQRVALARALAKPPRVLLLDEPLSNLDANLRADMRRLIRDLQQQFELTAIIVTHDWADAAALSDQVVVLNNGRIEQQGTVQELIDRPASDFVRGLIPVHTS